MILIEDLIFEVIKWMPLDKLYKYRLISKKINDICNNVIFRKNKKMIYYIKNFIKPSVFNSMLSFNFLHINYTNGLYIKLYPLYNYILSKCNLKDLRWLLLKHSLETNISFKLMDIHIDELIKTNDNLYITLNKIKFKQD